MFVELAEHLRCLEDHENTFLVVMPTRMDGRTIVEGMIGCPVCTREYRIVDGVARFDGAETPPVLSFASVPVDAAAVQAFIDLSGPGGVVILVGSAARLGADLAKLVEGVHIVACNPPPDVPLLERMSLFRSAARLPFRSSMARAVVVGEEHVSDTWTEEAVRVLLRGLRLVLFRVGAAPASITQLAVGPGVFVGEKS